jgi:hypothetical protein
MFVGRRAVQMWILCSAASFGRRLAPASLLHHAKCCWGELGNCKRLRCFFFWTAAPYHVFAGGKARSPRLKPIMDERWAMVLAEAGKALICSLSGRQAFAATASRFGGAAGRNEDGDLGRSHFARGDVRRAGGSGRHAECTGGICRDGR